MQLQTDAPINVQPSQSARFVVFVLVLFLVVLGWSAIRPHDYFTWFLEVAPALVGLAVLAFTYPKFRFTNLVYASDCCAGDHPVRWRPLHVRARAGLQLDSRPLASQPKLLRSCRSFCPGIRASNDRARSIHSAENREAWRMDVFHRRLCLPGNQRRLRIRGMAGSCWNGIPCR